MNHSLFLIRLLCVCACLVSCATTRIVTNDPQGEIYMDGRMVGKGEAQIRSMGPPHTAALSVERNGEVVAQGFISRQFKLQTILWGICSYYTGFYWGWYYPSYFQLNIMEKQAATKRVSSSWDAPRESIWMQPLSPAN